MQTGRELAKESVREIAARPDWDALKRALQRLRRHRLKSVLLAAADSGDDGDGGVGGEPGGEAAGVADGFVADEDVDVLAELAFFVEDAVAQAGMNGEEELQSFEKRGGGGGELHFAALLGKIAEWAGDVDRDAHLRLAGRRFVFVAERFGRFAEAAAPAVARGFAAA